MMVSEILKTKAYSPIEQQRSAKIADKLKNDAPTFGDTLDEYVQDVNTMQKESAEQVEKLVTGEPVDIHDVMIAAEKAKTSFSLLMELRNKALDMYREVIRIQV
jgi:flagellar hook-basal body complex protein FliE